MKPKPPPEASQLDLFQTPFDRLLNTGHPPCVLARKIDGPRFDIAFAEYYYPDTGTLDKDIHLLVGLHYLEHTFNKSNESRSFDAAHCFAETHVPNTGWWLWIYCKCFIRLAFDATYVCSSLRRVSRYTQY